MRLMSLPVKGWFRQLNKLKRKQDNGAGLKHGAVIESRRNITESQRKQ